MTKQIKLEIGDRIRYKNPGKATPKGTVVNFSYNKIIIEDDNGEVWVEERDNLIKIPR